MRQNHDSLQARRRGIKNKERRKIWKIPQEYMGEVRSFNSKKEDQEAFYVRKTKGENFVRNEFKRELVRF